MKSALPPLVPRPTRHRVFEDIENRVRSIKTVPDLQILTGRSVWSVYRRALSRFWRGWWWLTAAAFFGLFAALFGIQCSMPHYVVAGVILVVGGPFGLAISYAMRSFSTSTLVLITDRAQLIIVVKRRWGRVVVSPTDHWLDRRKIAGKIVKGQATQFRRSVLEALIESITNYEFSFKARAANKIVRNTYSEDLAALGLDPAPSWSTKTCSPHLRPHDSPRIG
jgi:hypothetical protein